MVHEPFVNLSLRFSSPEKTIPKLLRRVRLQVSDERTGNATVLNFSTEQVC